jgi:hypothetical protein
MKKSYTPEPLDTSEITLPAGLAEMTEALSCNTHDVWARGRMAEGWSYGEHLDEKNKLHPSLVPYEELPESEKQYDRTTATEAVRFLVANGYEIHPGERPRPACRPGEGGGFTVVDDGGVGAIVPPEGDLPLLWAAGRRLPDREVFGPVADRCFLLADVEVLRSGGAMISSRVSWERSATDLVWQLRNNPALTYLAAAPHILVAFARDAAVYISGGRASLVLAHGGSEGFSEGDFEAMTTALEAQLVDVMAGRKPLRILPVLGIDESGLPETAYEIPAAGNLADPDFWCITDSLNDRRIFDLAFDYVKHGGAVIDGLPRLSLGNLTTIDRREIEAYQNIRNLIVNYAGSGGVRPLSIAVFGAPGSGKSFGVTEIAKNILPGKVEKIEFNVSQFTDAEELGAAFQKVRDITLGGKLPLVFFDEFDSDGLRWLKSFLMPMQDGKFKDTSGEHPLGRCILVFAGGTSPSFERFTRPMTSDDPAEQKAFRELKVPDFVSRLRGTIDVLGPNPASERDKNYILRRALLMRSLCERKMKLGKGDRTRINENIVRAMLLTPEFKHGARSMEAILDMSRIEGGSWEPASLPFVSQLALHVDADAFMRLVLREVILGSYHEKLAVTIHEDFRRSNPTSDNNIPWEELPEDIKQSNRDQVRRYGELLGAAGYDFDSGDTPFPSVEEFDGAELEKMARRSHDVWMESKATAGWRYGPVKDSALKTHPLMVEWDELPEAEKQKDFDIAENIIPMMRSVGLRVYKTV